MRVRTTSGRGSRTARGGPVRCLLSGGGTAGHVVPAVTIAEEIRALDPDAELLYLGTAGGLEADLVPRAGIPFAAVPVTAIAGRRLIVAARSGVRAVAAVARARSIITRFRPDVALGTGGYVAGPVIMAAWLSGVPSFIHEQNLRPGITNRLLARVVRQVFVSFEESRAHFPIPGKVKFTGYPVRRLITEATREQGARSFGFRPDHPTLLVVGGSRGARTLNEAAKSGLPWLLSQMPCLQVLVSTGEAYYEEVRSALAAQGPAGDALQAGRLQVFAYIHDMPHAYAASDLVLCRSGGSVHELTARGLPAILVPSPNVAYDQQSDNARVLSRAGAARLVEDRELDGRRFGELVFRVFSEPDALKRMGSSSAALGRPEAARDIARLLLMRR